MLSQLCQQKVQLVILRQTDNHICLGNALLYQKVDICTVAAKHQTTLELGRQQLTALLILFNNLDLNPLLLQHRCQEAACAACADNQHSLQLFIGVREGIFKITNRLTLAYEIHVIAGDNIIITMRNNHLVAAENHGHQDILRNM